METIYRMLVSKDIENRILAMGLAEHLSKHEQLQLHNKLKSSYINHDLHLDSYPHNNVKNKRRWYTMYNGDLKGFELQSSMF